MAYTAATPLIVLHPHQLAKANVFSNTKTSFLVPDQDDKEKFDVVSRYLATASVLQLLTQLE